MKVKKIFAGMAASAIAMTTFAMGTATTVSAEGAVTGNAGVMFQTNLYTARNEAGNEAWGPVDGPAACVGNSVVGVNGGNGWDTAVDVSDTAIDGDGTYTVSIATSGTINTEPDLSKPANKKGWYVDGDAQKLNRMGSPWSMLGSYEPQNEITEETTQEQIEWGIGEENKATNFNMLIVSTDIPCFYDEDNKCFLDEEMTKEVTVSDVTVDMCGTTYTGGETAWKNDLTNVAFSLVNTYDDSGKGSMIDEAAFPTQDGTITITFTIKGLSGESSDSGDSSTGDSSTGDSSASDSSSSSSGSSSSKSSNNGGSNGGSKSGGGSTTTKTTSTSESLGDSASDATENAKSGAPAGIALALAAVAGAVVVVSRKK